MVSDTLFNPNLPLDAWMKKHLHPGLRVVDGYGFNDLAECRVQRLFISYAKGLRNIPGKVKTAQQAFDVQDYRPYSVSAFYDYRSRTVTLFKAYYEHNDFLKQVILINAFFKDFLHDNPIYGELPYYFVVDPFMQELLSLLMTYQYCAQSRELSGGFVHYGYCLIPDWIKLALKRVIELDALKWYIELAENGFKTEDPAINTWREISTHTPMYLPSYGFQRYSDCCFDEKSALQRSLAFAAFSDYSESPEPSPNEFQAFWLMVESDLKNMLPSDYYNHCVKLSSGKFPIRIYSNLQ